MRGFLPVGAAAPSKPRVRLGTPKSPKRSGGGVRDTARPIRGRWRNASAGLVALLLVLAVAALIGTGRALARRIPPPAVAPSGPTDYIAVPHRADAETKAKAGHAARSAGLPLISEPDVQDVETRSFK
jgi:hypothetical protein